MSAPSTVTESLEALLVLHHELIGREQYVEGEAVPVQPAVGSLEQLLLEDIFAAVGRALVRHRRRVGAPARALKLPMGGVRLLLHAYYMTVTWLPLELPMGGGRVAR